MCEFYAVSMLFDPLTGCIDRPAGSVGKAMGKSVRNLKVVSPDEVAAKKIRDSGYLDNTEGCDALRTRVGTGSQISLNGLVHECWVNGRLDNVYDEVFEMTKLKLIAETGAEFPDFRDPEDALPFIKALYKAVGEVYKPVSETEDEFVNSGEKYPPKVKKVLHMMSGCMVDSFNGLLEDLLDVKEGDNIESKRYLVKVSFDNNNAFVRFGVETKWNGGRSGVARYNWDLELMSDISDHRRTDNNLWIRTISNKVSFSAGAESVMGNSFKQESKLALDDRLGFIVLPSEEDGRWPNQDIVVYFSSNMKNLPEKKVERY